MQASVMQSTAVTCCFMWLAAEAVAGAPIDELVAKRIKSQLDERVGCVHQHLARDPRAAEAVPRAATAEGVGRSSQGAASQHRQAAQGVA